MPGEPGNRGACVIMPGGVSYIGIMNFINLGLGCFSASMSMNAVHKRLLITGGMGLFVGWYQPFVNEILLKLYVQDTVDAPVLHDLFDELWTTDNLTLFYITWFAPLLFVLMAVASRMHLCRPGIPRSALAGTSTWQWFLSKMWAFTTDSDLHVFLRRVAVMNVIKSTCGIVTLLPDRAHPTREFCSNPEARAELLFASCGDMMFSGHAAHIFLCLVGLVHDERIGIPFAGVTAFIAGLLLCVTRIHYTIDVVMAVFVVAFLEQQIPYDMKSKSSRGRMTSLSDEDSDGEGHDGRKNRLLEENADIPLPGSNV